MNSLEEKPEASEIEESTPSESFLQDKLKRLSVALTEPVSGITVHTAVGNSIRPTKAKEAVVVAATVASKPGRTQQQAPFKSQFLTLPAFRRERSPGVSPEQSPKDSSFSIFKKATQPTSPSTNHPSTAPKEDPASTGPSLPRTKDNPDASPNQTAAMTRTQQKLLLQRQHFLAGDANYLHHPKNQLRLSKETERIQREFVGIQQFENPLMDSLRRVMERKRVEVVQVSPGKPSNFAYLH
ncbi:hypothetical protein K493DRAFT_317592 [Basidiobolus meristosporus CBS 931.73]|uniref:Uncharacterized protein n=1 Tax=Basidiobolus meristosporus CBS 931.73 TaxID=1314790 RepID=A0A1Y1XZ26_9FUNG|nr:hypothetical protein K493DRAFT_317592 [Basidiobolus meristosporus CBS 931.73]|eukprot:ORX90979.1 hypothetical protein K493DRAFT_317592 [Basidiobolus meristosporus CBS 931.73]